MSSRHPSRLLLHDGEEPLSRVGIVTRRALQSLDEAGKSGERRTQLVAGVGDKVGTHLFDAPQRRKIVERHQHQIGSGEFRLARDRLDDHFERAIDRHAFGIFDTLFFAAGVGAADGFDQLGHAERERNRLALAQRRRQRTGRFVEREHTPIPVEGDDRIRQAGDDRIEPLTGALGDRDWPRQPPVFLAGASREQSSRRDDCKTGKRKTGGKSSEKRQPCEYDCRRDDHEPYAAPPTAAGREANFVQAHGGLLGQALQTDKPFGPV